MATVKSTTDDGTMKDDTQGREMYSESSLVYVARCVFLLYVFKVTPKRHKAPSNVRGHGRAAIHGPEFPYPLEHHSRQDQHLLPLQPTI